jgi:hypothetical protein
MGYDEGAWSDEIGNPEPKRKGVVISICDRTGNMVRPWAEAGYECWCVDLQHSIRKDRVELVGDGKIYFVWGDARSWRLPESVRGRVSIGFGFPPCTDLSLSGARDHQKKSGWALADALQIFDSIEVAFSYGGFPYMLENPKSKLSTHRRKFDHKFQPWHYGDLYTKETWLWTGNGFVMPPALHAERPPGVTEKIWLMPPSDERADIRSETPMGFARAVFAANHQAIRKAA